MVQASHNADGPCSEHCRALRVCLLGGFRVFVGVQPIPDVGWRLRRARSLVKVLALAPDHRHHRERVMGLLLWPNLDTPSALNNLYHAVHVAQKRRKSGCTDR